MGVVTGAPVVAERFGMERAGKKVVRRVGSIGIWEELRVGAKVVLAVALREAATWEAGAETVAYTVVVTAVVAMLVVAVKRAGAVKAAEARPVVVREVVVRA
eukprot:4013771-Prymnesium_polylepis.1